MFILPPKNDSDNLAEQERPNKTKIPYAYKASEDDPLVLVPDEEKAVLVEEALDYRHSSRKAAAYLASKTGDS